VEQNLSHSWASIELKKLEVISKMMAYGSREVTNYNTEHNEENSLYVHHIEDK
jgi:hypothetical protein